jgi:four helix bundle protein
VREPIRRVEDLDVYRKLVILHLEVHALTMNFPRYELHELGSQLRRSSNSVAANLAEGWNNKHRSIYLEAINRAIGELRETRHHLAMAFHKGHCSENIYGSLTTRYEECARMLAGLERAVSASRRNR